MTDSDTAFTVDTSIPEETLIDLTRAVDALDFFRMVVHDTLTEPETDRELGDYIKRATLYLQFLRDRVEKNDLLSVTTMPITETMIRRRISRLLRTSTQAVRS